MKRFVISAMRHRFLADLRTLTFGGSLLVAACLASWMIFAEAVQADCSPGQISCGGYCCPQGYVCTQGACACPYQPCDVDGTWTCPTSDPNNCGGCGSVCSSGQECCDVVNADGKHAGKCTDLNSDPVNCGACGKLCPAVANGTPACVNKSCTVDCNDGLTNSNGVCCEQNAYANHGSGATSCNPAIACPNAQCGDDPNIVPVGFYCRCPSGFSCQEGPPPQQPPHSCGGPPPRSTLEFCLPSS